MHFWKSWYTFPECPNSYSSKCWNKLKLIVYSKKKVSTDVEHLDAKIAVLTSLFKYFNQNPKSFVQYEITISQIKSFELKKNHFPHLFFCQRGLLFWQPCMSFSSKNPKNNENERFSEKITSVKVLVWKGTRHFSQSFRERFGRKMTKFSDQFPKIFFLGFLDKKLFLSPNVPCTRRMQYWQHSGIFCQKLEKVSLKDW